MVKIDYKELVKNLPGPVFAADQKTGEVLDCNADAARLVGRSRKEIIGRHQSELHPKGEVENYQEGFKAHMKKSRSISFEAEVQHRDGRRIPVVINMFVVRTKGRDVGVGLFTDISKHRQVQDILHQAKDKYLAIFDSANDIIALVDKRGRIVEINRRVEDILGIKPDEAIGKRFTSVGLLKAKQLPKMVKVFNDMVRKRKTLRLFPVEVSDKKGNPVFLEASTRPITKDGGLEAFVAVLRDVTDRKKAEDELRASEGKFRVIFEGATDGILLADTKTKKFAFANPKICEITGYSLEELLKLDVTKIHPKKDLPHVVDQFEKQVKGKLTLAVDIPVLRKDNQVVYCDVNSKTVEIKKKKYLVGFFRDVTDRRKAEQALENLLEREKASAKQWQETFDAASDIMTLISPDFEIIKVNKAGCDSTGKKPDELIGKKCYEVIHGLENPITGCPCQDLVKTKKAGSGEVTEGGRHYLVTASPVLGDDGKLEAFVHTAKDITHRKEAEKKLQQSEEKYRTLVENASDFIYLIDQKNRVLSLNKAAAGFLGKTPEETVGKTVFDLFPEEVAAGYSKNMKKVLATGIGQTSETRVVGEGKELWMSVSLNPVRDQEGKAFGVLGVSRDITERGRAEAVLQESEEKYRTLTENLNEVVYRADPRTLVSIYVNSAIRKVYGYTPQQWISNPTLWEESIYPDDRERTFREIAGYRKRFESGSVEYRIIRKDKTVRWVEDRFTWQKDSQGNVISLNGIVYDITEQKKAEQQLRHHHRELETAYRKLREAQAQLVQSAKMAALGELGAGIAHELNQPLGGIKGFAQVIQKELERGSLLREDLAKIQEQTDRMAKIIKNISTFARPASFAFAPLDVNVPLTDALSLISQQLRVHKVKVTEHLQSDLPKVNGDSNQLQQVFLNLLNNARDALDATRKKNKQLVVTTKTVSEFIEIVVKDTGCGISRENLERVFDPFFTTKSPSRGVGLGLSVSYGIIRDHSGLIDAASVKNKGTAVRILLPILRSKTCWEIKKCRESTRSQCPAFKENKGHLCWTVGEEVCLQEFVKPQRAEVEECKKCEVYKQKRIPRFAFQKSGDLV